VEGVRTRKAWTVAAAAIVAVVLFYGPIAAGGGHAPPGYRIVAEEALVRGVVSYAAVQDRTHSVRFARMDGGAAVQLATVTSHDRVLTSEPTSSMCVRRNCLLAGNGDFFHMGSGQPVGGVIADGVLVRTPRPGHVQLVITSDERWSATELEWVGHLAGLSEGEAPPEPGVDLPGLLGSESEADDGAGLHPNPGVNNPTHPESQLLNHPQ
jgi:hypothetical protein